MKKILLVLLLIYIRQISMAQDLGISDDWNFVKVVSKTMLLDTVSRGDTVFKLITVRKYQNKWRPDRVANITIEEVRHVQGGKCWSTIVFGASKIELNAVYAFGEKRKRNKIKIYTDLQPKNDTIKTDTFSTYKVRCNIDTVSLRNAVRKIEEKGLTKDSPAVADSIGFLTFSDMLPVKESKKNWALGISFTPQIAFARIHVDDASFSEATKLDNRVQQTRPIYGYSYAFSVHKWVNNYNRFYGSIGYERMGWENKQSSVDWSTGYSSYDTTTVYKLGFWQAGLGYTYTGKTAPVRFVLDLGMNVLWKNNDHFFQNKEQISNEPGFRNTLLMGSIGAGINVSLNRKLSFECLPNVSIPFTPVHSAHLRTSLYNVGFTGRLLFDFYKR